MRVAKAHLLVREAREEESYIFNTERFRGLSIPTLLLSGEDSPQFFKAITESVHAVLPTSRIAVMPGQQHLAMLTAPDLFLHEVMAFLAEPE
jgi:pimeloyl-ACP methyl ester carboxylesterase